MLHYPLPFALSYPPHTSPAAIPKSYACMYVCVCMYICLSSGCQVVFVTCVLRFALCFIAAASNRLFRCAIAIVFVVAVVTCYCSCCYLHWANSSRTAKLCTVEQIRGKCRVQNRKVHTNKTIWISIDLVRLLFTITHMINYCLIHIKCPLKDVISNIISYLEIALNLIHKILLSLSFVFIRIIV